MNTSAWTCKTHGKPMPCYDCKLGEYIRCLDENNNGKNPPHDLTELKKWLKIK